MGKFILMLPAALIFWLFVFYAQELTSRSSGAPQGASGAYADQGADCTACHGGSAVLDFNIISTSIPNVGYEPDSVYDLTIRLNGDGAKGFQITMQDARGLMQGVLIPNAESKMAGTKYLTHQFPKSDTVAIWNVKWRAPSLGIGTVTLYGAFAISRQHTFRTILNFPQRQAKSDLQILDFHPKKIGKGGKLLVQGSAFNHLDSMKFGRIKIETLQVLNDSNCIAIIDSIGQDPIQIFDSIHYVLMSGLKWIPKPTVVRLNTDSFLVPDFPEIIGRNFLEVDTVWNNRKIIRDFQVVSDTLIRIFANSIQSGKFFVHSEGGIDSSKSFTVYLPVGLGLANQNMLWFDAASRYLLSHDHKLRTLYVHNIQGSMVHKFLFVERYQLPDSWEPGIYFLRSDLGEYLKIYLP